jgi:hypothetical protein
MMASDTIDRKESFDWQAVVRQLLEICLLFTRLARFESGGNGLASPTSIDGAGTWTIKWIIASETTA